MKLELMHRFPVLIALIFCSVTFLAGCIRLHYVEIAGSVNEGITFSLLKEDPNQHSDPRPAQYEIWDLGVIHYPGGNIVGEYSTIWLVQGHFTLSTITYGEESELYSTSVKAMPLKAGGYYHFFASGSGCIAETHFRIDSNGKAVAGWEE